MDPLEIQLEEALGRHPINASLFLPFVLARIRRQNATFADIAVRFSNIGEPGEREQTIRIFWRPETATASVLGFDERTITEFAACGIAFIVCSELAGMTVRSIADVGDRFDYWLTDGEQGLGLEVSGTESEEFSVLEARHREKIRQLRENPYEVDGYVVVAGFTLRQAILSFHRYRDGV